MVAMQGSVTDFGVARLGVGLCPKCLQDAPQMANRTVGAADIAARLDALSAAHVLEVDVFNLDSNRGGITDHFRSPPWGVGDTQSKMWWDAIREWRAAGPAPSRPRTVFDSVLQTRHKSDEVPTSAVQSDDETGEAASETDDVARVSRLADAPLSSILWHVDPITIKVPSDQTEPFASSSDRVSLAGLRGECEKTQIWLRAADKTAVLENISVAFSSSTMTALNWTALQQGYVRCSPPGAGGPGWQGYTCLQAGATKSRPCKAGWYADPLFPPLNNGVVVPMVPAGKAQPIFLSACIPGGATAGNFSGVVTVSGKVGGAGFKFAVPWTVEVWPLDLPALDHPDSFRAAIGWADWVGWSGDDMPDYSLHAFHPDRSQSWVWDRWLPFLAQRRTPPHQLYQVAPRPIEFYTRLASLGSRWMSLMDVSAPLQYSSPKRNYSAQYLQHVLDTLAPTVENATRLGIVDRMYVYGFGKNSDVFSTCCAVRLANPKSIAVKDEWPAEQNATVYALFGAVKARWPALRTVAALDWPVMPDSLPVDVWVDLYSDYFCDSMAGSDCGRFNKAKAVQRKQWLDAKPSHEYWWYWCLQPHDPRFLNTFIEFPAIQARMLFWLASLHGINGMMYYQNNVWATEGVAARCGSPAKCKLCDRGPDRSAFSEWIPESYPGPEPGSLNGDGSLTAPGVDGPLSTIRLENIVDGIEDAALWAMLGVDASTGLSRGADLNQQLVVNGTHRNENPMLMESVRRQAAHRIIAAARSTAPASKTDDGCVGELLYNGICLPADRPWPPPFNTTYFCRKCNQTYHGGPPAHPRYPPWYHDPPAVINVSIGRQLFVDTFLIESMLGVQLSGHAATWGDDSQVLKSTEPWETQTQASGGVPYNCDYQQTYPEGRGFLPSGVGPRSQVPHWFQCDWPQGPKAVGYAATFEGTVTFDEDLKLFRMFYTCGRPAENAADTAQGLCHAESDNGRQWTKRLVGTGENENTNRVVREAFDSAIVWQDYTEPAGSPRRWVMSSVPKDNDFRHCRIRVSNNGFTWTVAVNASGPVQDATSVFCKQNALSLNFASDSPAGLSDILAHRQSLPPKVGFLTEARLHQRASDPAVSRTCVRGS
eukprot:COSAG04_NODE_2068_length_4871_cov_2.073973_1_plen_1105_part_00